MKTNIILAGVGGQGILSIAAILGEAAMNEGLYIKQAEVHGMSQRGGEVLSNLRISSDPIRCDLIALGTADVIISLEPMEALRYLPYLSKEGWMITSSNPFVNISNYPSEKQLQNELSHYSHVVQVDIEKLSSENNMKKCGNVILLGAASKVIGIDYDKLESAVARLFSAKGETVVEMNRKALAIGKANSI